ncbi:MAG: hypothetical protein DMF77_15630 [Acidobacteria bacterium]|nr:MAG: hypothetical protein DMF77_15630 [Acidobacteriota bacterium]
MAELVHEREIALSGPDGTIYDRALVYAEPNGRTTWAGFIEFVPSKGNRTVRTDHETTQSNIEGVAYWGTGLELVYLDGALARAVRRTSAPQTAGGTTGTSPVLGAEGVVHLRLETIDPAAPLRLMKTRTLVPGQRRWIKEGGGVVYERMVHAPSAGHPGAYDFVAQFGSENAAGLMANTLWNDLHGLGARLLVEGREVALTNAAIKDALLAARAV